MNHFHNVSPNCPKLARAILRNTFLCLASLLACSSLSPAAPTQGAYLKASNTGAGDAFGGSTAIDGNTLVVGALWETSNATTINGDQTDNSSSSRGAAYVFVKDQQGWSQQAYLKGSNAATYSIFGAGVAISGDTIVVGASRNPGPQGEYEMGAAYVFVRNGSTWSQQAILRASNAGEGDNFGASISISGDTIVVGAPYEDSHTTGINGDGSNNDSRTSGAAYVFTRNGSTWTQQAFLKPSHSIPDRGPEWGMRFGGPIKIDGDTVIVSAPYERSNASGVNGDASNDSLTDAGAVFVFARENNQWHQQAYLKSNIPTTLGRFGEVTALSGDTIAVGHRSHGNTGAVYLFNRNGTTWSGPTILKARTPINGETFGSSLAIENKTMLIGASAGSGSVYLFTKNQGIWSQKTRFSAANTGSGPADSSGDRFGGSMDLSNGTAIISAVQDDSNATGVNGDQPNDLATGSGAAYVFTGFQPDVALSIDILNDPLIAGGAPADVFRVSATNQGVQEATDLSISQLTGLPAGVILTDATASGGSFENGVWTLSMDPGSSASLTFSLQALSTAAPGTGVIPLGVEAGSIHPPDADLSNNTASASASIISPSQAPVSITASPAINRQNGLLVSKVDVRNNNSEAIPAFRIFVKNLPPDAVLYNRSGIEGGIPYLLYNRSLAAGAEVTLSVEVFRPSLNASFSPEFEIELLASPVTTTPVSGTGIDVARMETLSNGEKLIEIASIPGTTYAVEYSSNMSDWKRAEGILTASANRLQWIDSGPPKTETTPSEASSRFYRFVQLPPAP